MRKSIVKLLGVVNDVFKIVAECLRMTKNYFICIMRFNFFLVKYKAERDPAVVAWFVKASVFHSVNSAPSANGGSNPALGMV